MCIRDRHDTCKQRECRSDVDSGPREYRSKPQDSDGNPWPYDRLLSPLQYHSQRSASYDDGHEREYERDERFWFNGRTRDGKEHLYEGVGPRPDEDEARKRAEQREGRSQRGVLVAFHHEDPEPDDHHQNHRGE